MNSIFENLKCEKCGKKTVQTNKLDTVKCKTCGEILFTIETKAPKRAYLIDPKYKWMQDLEAIEYLAYYFPKKIGHRINPQHENDGYSQALLDFKSTTRDAEIINKINKVFLPLFEDKQISEDVRIVVAPPSYTMSQNKRLKKLVEILCGKFKCSNAANALVRESNVPESTWGCHRTKEMHLSSIVCQKKLIKHKKILLIDDITTSGCTINACKEILLNNGARSVKCLVLGKTKRDQ